MLSTFTKAEIQNFYHHSNIVEDTPEGFAISPSQTIEGHEFLVIPHELPIVACTNEPFDYTIPFSAERVTELLRTLGIDDNYMRDTHAASLRFGTHWLQDRRSFFRITDPIHASSMQILILRDQPELGCGWMDLPCSAESQLARLASHSYSKICPNSMILRAYIISCDHESELIQHACSHEWRQLCG